MFCCIDFKCPDLLQNYLCVETYKTSLNNKDFNISNFLLIDLAVFISYSLGTDGAMDASTV